MRRYERQYVSGKCINCMDRIEMDLDSFLGLLNEGVAKKCEPCGGTGYLSTERIRELGWAE